jgi:hypothetical protein
MSLSGKPIGRSVYFSQSGVGTVGTEFLSTDKPPPGWYHAQIYTSSSDAALGANLQLFVGSTPWGFVPTGPVTSALVLILQLEGSRAVRLVLTPIEAPPAADWSYDSRGQGAP